MRILLIDADERLASASRLLFGQKNIALDRAANMVAAEDLAQSGRYDLIVIDWEFYEGEEPNLPQSFRSAPVLVLTEDGGSANDARLYSRGADDCLGKPFTCDEFVARVATLVRPPARFLNDVVIEGGLAFDFVSRQASVRGEVLNLVTAEALLLDALLRRLGRITPRSTLAKILSPDSRRCDARILDKYVAGLLRKLEATGSTLGIARLEGTGYLLAVSELS